MKLSFTDILRSEIARMQTLHPDRVGELSRAHASIIEGHVIDTGDGNGKVLSRNGNTWYATNSHCTCKAAAFDKPCRHLQAWKLYQHIAKKYAQVCAAPPLPWEEDLSEPETEASVTAPTTVAPALPEAPCSCNAYVMIAGRQVQVTLRGTDEREVLTRLEAVLACYPVSQAAVAPSPVPETAPVVAPITERPTTVPPEAWCKIHGKEMTLHTSQTDGSQWYSHLLAKDVFCKGKPKVPKGGAA